MNALKTLTSSLYENASPYKAWKILKLLECLSENELGFNASNAMVCLEEEKDTRIGFPTWRFPWFKLTYFKHVGTEIACIVDLILSFS